MLEQHSSCSYDYLELGGDGNGGYSYVTDTDQCILVLLFSLQLSVMSLPALMENAYLLECVNVNADG